MPDNPDADDTMSEEIELNLDDVEYEEVLDFDENTAEISHDEIDSLLTSTVPPLEDGYTEAMWLHSLVEQYHLRIYDRDPKQPITEMDLEDAFEFAFTIIDAIRLYYASRMSAEEVATDVASRLGFGPIRQKHMKEYKAFKEKLAKTSGEIK